MTDLDKAVRESHRATPENRLWWAQRRFLHEWSLRSTAARRALGGTAYLQEQMELFDAQLQALRLAAQEEK